MASWVLIRDQEPGLKSRAGRRAEGREDGRLEKEGRAEGEGRKEGRKEEEDKVHRNGRECIGIEEERAARRKESFGCRMRCDGDGAGKRSSERARAREGVSEL